MVEEINAGMEPEKPKGISTVWAIVIIVVIAILIGGGIWYWYYKTAVNDTTNVNIPEKTASTSASASTSALPSTSGTDETANWKTYTNNTYDFSFKYPTEWTKKAPVSGEDDALVYIFSNNEYPPKEEPIQYLVFVNHKNSLPSVSKTQDTINGYTVNITKDEPSMAGVLKYYFTKDNKTYIVVSFAPYDETTPLIGQDKEYPQFQKIITTFKFL